MEQKKLSYVEEPLVIENPSPKQIEFVNKLRDHKLQTLAEMRRDWHVYFPNSKWK